MHIFMAAPFCIRDGNQFKSTIAIGESGRSSIYVFSTKRMSIQLKTRKCAQGSSGAHAKAWKRKISMTMAAAN